MKIVCNVFVANRQFAVSAHKPRKHAKATLALCKHPKTGDHFMLLFTSQNKNGTKYNIKGNIKQVLTRFVNEGKCTIQFVTPEHDLLINSDVIQLKGFLHLFKRVLENKMSDKELSVSSMAVTPVKAKDIGPRKLFIVKRSDYPIKGFPRTLDELHINGIQRCSIDKGILQLNKLIILDLSDNCIEFIPNELGNLPNLRELNMSQNTLGQSVRSQWNWMSGCILKTLLLLDLSHNELSEIPNQIGKFHQLTTLNLNNNALRTLPASIGNLKNLKIFSASDNNISALPGSVKNLRLQTLDLSNNKFEQYVPHRMSFISKPRPICTLKEYASRKVIGARLPYPPGSLPLTVINYLDSAKFCVCGRACFEHFLSSTHYLLLTNIAECVSTSARDLMYVPINCSFCSLKCFHFQNRTRNPIVR